jgi:hypothetical protein
VDITSILKGFLLAAETAAGSDYESAGGAYKSENGRGVLRRVDTTSLRVKGSRHGQERKSGQIKGKLLHENLTTVNMGMGIGCQRAASSILRECTGESRSSKKIVSQFKLWQGLVGGDLI